MESQHTDASNPLSNRLRSAREAMRYSIADVSAITSIRPRVLSAIDEGRFVELPPVYMRSFIKNYAKAVGITEQEVELLMNENLPKEIKHTAVANVTVQRTTQATTSRNTHNGTQQQLSQGNSTTAESYMNRNLAHVGMSPSQKKLTVIASSLVALLAVGGLVYLFVLKPTPQPTQSTSGIAPMAITENDSNSNSGDGSSGGLMSFFSEEGTTLTDSLQLKVVASDTAWISITSDGKESDQVTLLPGQTKVWGADERFVLSVGNAGGVTLFRNGTQLPALGAKGEIVRSIRIKKNEFITSSSPWRSQRDTTRNKPLAKTTTSQNNYKAIATKPTTSVISSAPNKPQSSTVAIPKSPSQSGTQGSSVGNSNTSAQTRTLPNTTLRNTAVKTGTITTSNPSTTNLKTSETSAITRKPSTTIPPTISPTAQTKVPSPKPNPSVTLQDGTVKPLVKSPKKKDDDAEKKRREELMKRARQLEITPVQLKPSSP
jgi:cytoskeletal protein RodZ